jgi:hypothetical protein
MNVLLIPATVVLVLSSGFAFGQESAAAIPAPLATASPGIKNIGIFLQQCPDRDPAYAEISKDFAVYVNDQPTTTPLCTEPISKMPVAQYTDALIVRQGLRVMYYMDRGQSGHLPWTSGTLYDWMKSKIQGIDIVDGVVGGYCCTTIGGKRFFVGGSQDDSNRDFDRSWRGISGNIAFYAHEARHVDGFPHTSCCGITNGCDNSFDQANLSAYGVQWWLDKLWLDGTINVGYECLADASEVSASTRWFTDGINGQYRTRFCTNLPPIVNAPASPGGACPVQPRRRSAKK